MDKSEKMKWWNEARFGMFIHYILLGWRDHYYHRDKKQGSISKDSYIREKIEDKAGKWKTYYYRATSTST